MPHKAQDKSVHQWIPIVMALIAVTSLAVTIYFSYKQQENARSVLSATLALKFDDQFDSLAMRESRRSFAKAILDNKEPDEDVIGFFDTIGFLARRRSVDIEIVWNEFGYYILYYWPAARPYVEKWRAEDHDNSYYENAEWLYKKILLKDSSRLHKKPQQEVPSRKELRSFLKDEASLPKR